MPLLRVEFVLEISSPRRSRRRLIWPAEQLEIAPLFIPDRHILIGWSPCRTALSTKQVIAELSGTVDIVQNKCEVVDNNTYFKYMCCAFWYCTVL